MTSHVTLLATFCIDSNPASRWLHSNASLWHQGLPPTRTICKPMRTIAVEVSGYQESWTQGRKLGKQFPRSPWMSKALWGSPLKATSLKWVPALHPWVCDSWCLASFLGAFGILPVAWFRVLGIFSIATLMVSLAMIPSMVVTLNVLNWQTLNTSQVFLHCPVSLTKSNQKHLCCFLNIVQPSGFFHQINWFIIQTHPPIKPQKKK